MLRMLRLGDGGLGCFQGGAESSAATIDAVLARVGGDVRPFQFANHTGFQRLEVGAACAHCSMSAARRRFPTPSARTPARWRSSFRARASG